MDLFRNVYLPICHECVLLRGPYQNEKAVQCFLLSKDYLMKVSLCYRLRCIYCVFTFLMKPKSVTNISTTEIQVIYLQAYHQWGCDDYSVEWVMEIVLMVRQFSGKIECFISVYIVSLKVIFPIKIYYFFLTKTPKIS